MQTTVKDTLSDRTKIDQQDSRAWVRIIDQQDSRAWVRIFVVLLYLFSVTLTALLLAVYYSLLWNPIPQVFNINENNSDSTGVLSNGGRLTVNRKG